MMVRVLDPDEKSKKEIHPHALKRFRDWQDEVEREVPQLVELTDSELNADVARYLTENEQAEAKAYREEIIDWLLSCMDTEKTASLYATPQYNTWIISTMSDLKKLIRTVYQRKEDGAKQEAERIQEEERQRAKKAEDDRRRKAARKALDVPEADAKKYLSDEEYIEFLESIPGAIDAYLKEGEYYALDSRSFWFNVWLRRIKNRREEDEAKLAAAEQFWSFNDSLCKAIEELKSKLHAHKQNTDKYFDKDNHFPRQNLAPCLLPSQRKELLKEIEHMARGELKALVPEVYLDFISWENTYYYRLRPIADYVFEGVPCLAFSFEVEAVAESEIQLIPHQRVFRGYRFNLPVINNEGYRAVLQKPKFLGYFYQHLSPIKLPPVSWQTIPLNLLTGLMQGEIVPQGAKVIEASEVEITYEVKKFDELVDIPVSFQACLGEMQGFEGMVTAGVISNQTARIIIEQTPELKSAPIQGTAATDQPPGFTKEQFIEKVTGLGYPKAHAEILFQKIPEGLDLDEAVRWALREYRKIISENTIFESYYD